MNTTQIQNLHPTHVDFPDQVGKVDTNKLYAATLEIQSRFTHNEFIRFLGSNEIWLNAESIVEIGCGTGAHTQLIKDAKLLEEKKYLGVDIEEEFIQLASRRLPELEFRCSDALDLDLEVCDLLLGVAVLQHLGSLDHAISRLKNCLKESGHMIFFDTNGSSVPYSSSPEIPTLNKMLTQASAKATEGKRNDQCLIELEKNARNWGLEVVCIENPSVTVDATASDDFIRFFYFAGELTRRFFNASFSQENLLAELLDWKKSNGKAWMNSWRWLVVGRTQK